MDGWIVASYICMYTMTCSLVHKSKPHLGKKLKCIYNKVSNNSYTPLFWKKILCNFHTLVYWRIMTGHSIFAAPIMLIKLNTVNTNHPVSAESTVTLEIWLFQQFVRLNTHSSWLWPPWSDLPSSSGLPTILWCLIVNVFPTHSQMVSLQLSLRQLKLTY